MNDRALFSRTSVQARAFVLCLFVGLCLTSGVVSAAPPTPPNRSSLPDIVASPQVVCLPLPAGRAQLSGRITADDTGQGLVGVVRVDVSPGRNTIDSSVQTAANGTFVITVAAPATVWLYFESNDERYAGEWYNNAVLRDDAIALNVKPDDNLTNLNVSLVRGATVTGNVTADDSGLPLPDVLVTAVGSETYTQRSAITDANGHYALIGLATDSYAISFQPQSVTNSHYVREYYDDQIVAPGNLLGVTSPETITGIDAALGLGALIRGQVVASDTGDPLSAIKVTAESADFDFQAAGFTDTTGRYELTVPTGAYRVFFEGRDYYLSEWYDNRPPTGTPTPVQASAPQITSGIDAALTKGGRLNGRVSDAETGEPISGAYALVVDIFDGDSIAFGFTDEQGYYELRSGLPTGNYKILFGREEDYNGTPGYIPSYYNGKASLLTADVVKVLAPNIVSNINGVLAPCATLSSVYIPLIMRSAK